MNKIKLLIYKDKSYDVMKKMPIQVLLIYYIATVTKSLADNLLHRAKLLLGFLMGNKYIEIKPAIHTEI